MALVINTNIASLNAQNNLSTSQSALQTSLQRLSSGLRINSAKDDAAGLAIATRMSSQINGLTQAARNANDGISMSQTASGAMSTISDNLQRMRTLAVQAANGSNSTSDRQAMQAEIAQLQQNINQITSTTAFNGTNLIDGSLTNAQFQVGANANQTINFAIGNESANAIGTNTLSTSNTTTGSGIGIAKAGTTSGSIPINSTQGQTLTINGAGANSTKTVTIAASTTATTAGSAHDIAASVNAVSSTTGVTATASTTEVLGGFAAGTVSLKLQSNPNSSGAYTTSTPITISATLASSNDLAGLTSAINAQSGTTGVSAVANTITGQITLSNGAGFDIGISNTSAEAGITVQSQTAAGANNGNAVTLGTGGASNDSATVSGNLSFNSNGAYTMSSNLSSSSAGGLFLTAAGASEAANAVNGSALSSVASIDVTTLVGQTPTGANNAIKIIDGALASVNAAQAAMGAIQNRFTSVITNLNTTAQNLTASRSRIQDTDFAAETANLTRGQILQQAGTAMLAQANSLPNGVMALLK